MATRQINARFGVDVESPEGIAGIISRTMFTWVSPLFTLSKNRRKEHRELEESDIWKLLHFDQTDNIAKRFNSGWEHEQERLNNLNQQDHKTGIKKEKDGVSAQALERIRKENERLVRLSLFNVIKPRFLRAGGVKLIQTLVAFLLPVILNGLLTFVDDTKTPPAWTGYVWVLGLAAVMVVRAIASNNYFFMVMRCSFQVQSAVNTATYRKALRLSMASRQSNTIGEIVNIMQLDAKKLGEFVMVIHVMWDALFQIAGFLTILYFFIGWPCFVGLAVMMIAVPTNFRIMKAMLVATAKMVKITDTRVKVTNECLQGIMGIKMTAWEEKMVEVLDGVRTKEMKQLQHTLYYRSISTTFMVALPVVTACAAISVYAAAGGEITAPILFTAVVSFTQLRFPLLVFPRAMTLLATSRVSVGRVAAFLSLDEFAAIDDNSNGNDAESRKKSKQSVTARNAIEMVNGTFYFANPASSPERHMLAIAAPSHAKQRRGMSSRSKAQKTSDIDPLALTAEQKATRCTSNAALTDINLNIPQGSLVAIIGPVGAGKTSLLHAMLGELYKTAGQINVNGDIAYAAQTPWILNASLRNNILFGQAFDQERYDEVLEACELTHDLQILEAGDQTMIGERGINLSGGQKQRVSIARAVYSDKDIVILDDPLSALDPAVGSAVFNKCILGMMGNKTRVLVTNQLGFLKQCDRIVVLARTQTANILPTTSSSSVSSSSSSTSSTLASNSKNKNSFEVNTCDRKSFSNSKRKTLEVYTQDDGVKKVVSDLVKNEHTNVETKPQESSDMDTPLEIKLLGENEAADSESTDGFGISATIVEQGTYNELVRDGLEFAALLSKFNSERQQSSTTSVSSARVTNVKVDSLSPKVGTVNFLLDDEDDDIEEALLEEEAKGEEEEGEEEEDKKKEVTLSKSVKVLMTKEERARGAVGLQQYLNWMRSGGGAFRFLFIVFLFVLAQTAAVMNVYWISLWTTAVRDGYESTPFVSSNATLEEREEGGLTFYLVGYLILALMFALLTLGRVLGILFMGLKASITMHKLLLESILGAPMRFFDQTPIGRILARFSSDLYQLDNDTAQKFGFFLTQALAAISTLITISLATPIFAVAIPPLGIVYLYLLQQFRPVARELKRLESISRSPVYAHMAESLSGLTTIRAYGHTPKFMLDNGNLIDNNIKNYYLMRSSERWLGIRLEFLGATVTLLAGIAVVYSAMQGLIDSGTAGLSLNFSTAITMHLSFSVRAFGELEAAMNCVERIVHYSIKVPQEAPRTISKNPANMNTSWPQNGTIKVTNLHMRYRKDTALVLKGISFNVNAGERVGIVGRTGSGKSSLILCLLRLVEAEKIDGCAAPIVIDGVDISQIGLKELRRKIGIVAQNPVIFSGTVRSNLDPFNGRTDAELWHALEQCNLKAMVAEYPDKLQHAVSEFGESFSQGQRQLLCLARSILDQTRILLLDEATSSIDFETDALIQETIRSPTSFGGCTILTIAHRINTVIDNDRILVLDGGEVAEYDSPAVLLADKRSMFFGMVKQHRRKAE